MGAVEDLLPCIRYFDICHVYLRNFSLDLLTQGSFENVTQPWTIHKSSPKWESCTSWSTREIWEDEIRWMYISFSMSYVSGGVHRNVEVCIFWGPGRKLSPAHSYWNENRRYQELRKFDHWQGFVMVHGPLWDLHRHRWDLWWYWFLRHHRW